MCFAVQPVLLQGGEKRVHLVTGIYDYGFPRRLASEDGAILEKVGNCACFDEHEPVCLPTPHS